MGKKEKQVLQRIVDLKNFIKQAKNYDTYSDYLTSICYVYGDKYKRCMLEFQHLEHMLDCDTDSTYDSFRKIINKIFDANKEITVLRNMYSVIDIRNYYVHQALIDLENGLISKELFDDGLVAFFFYICEVEDYITNHLNNDKKVFTELNDIG